MSITRYDLDSSADGYFDDPFMKVRKQGKFVLHSDYAALKEAASRSLDDAYNSFGDREEAHERLIDVAKLVVKSWNTVELGTLKDAIEDMAALVGEGK